MTGRKKANELRKTMRQHLIDQRNAKLAAAKVCYENAKFYRDQDSLPGVMYWEQEYHRLTAEAAAVSR